MRSREQTLRSVGSCDCAHLPRCASLARMSQLPVRALIVAIALEIALHRVQK